jgi:hypothetical protein
MKEDMADFLEIAGDGVGQLSTTNIINAIAFHD